MKNYYNKNFEPNYITAEQINSNVRRLLAKNPSAFTFYGTGTYIIGREDIAIIDPGPIIDSHIQNLLKITNKAKRVNLFITHTHADHSPAANIIKAKINCTTYGYGPYPNPTCQATGQAGTGNTGGGGGGGSRYNPGSSYGAGGNGGSGIVIIRYKFQ